MTLCGRGCSWACACACDCHSKISLSCASKSFFDSFIFSSNRVKSIKPPCATAIDKSSLSRPQLLWHFAAGKAKTNSLSQCCGRRRSTRQFRLVLAPKLRNDTSTEQIMDFSITVIWIRYFFCQCSGNFFQSFFSTVNVFANRNGSSAAGCKQNQRRKGHFESASDWLD